MKRYRFVGFIYKIGINRCVDIPVEISAKLGDENFIPVVIRTAGISKHTNLIPSGSGFLRLFLDSEIRRKTRKDTGQFIDIEIERDIENRKVEIPEDLQEILEENKTAEIIFENMTVNQQREIVSYIKKAKQEETRRNRIIKVVGILLKEASRRKRK